MWFILPFARRRADRRGAGPTGDQVRALALPELHVASTNLIVLAFVVFTMLSLS